MSGSVQECNLCGCARLEPLDTRSDGALVLRCAACGHGTVAVIPGDVSGFYGDEYYSGAGESEIGYGDYQFMAEHGLAWAASLLRLLKPGGRVLDVGCADGTLLRKLSASHDCFGIEVNPRMAGLCEENGIRIIARDLLDPDIVPRYGGSFDIVSAIAAFEHIPDFRASVQAALALLRPDGVLLFEVPLISDSHPSGMWFRSSLEHIHYPSERSLRNFFENGLNLRLVGGECVIRDFASTFIGLVRKDPALAESDADLFRRLVFGPVSGLQTPRERRFRCHLDLLHAAQSTPESLSLLASLEPGDLNSNDLRRFAQLWGVDIARLISQHQESARLRSELESLHLEGTRLRTELESLHLEGTRLRTELESLHVEGTRLKTELESLYVEGTRLRTEASAERANLQTEIRSLTEINRGLVRRNEDLLFSWSWKLTAPMRAALRFFRR
jgi:SAM-dependent methyltransferase